MVLLKEKYQHLQSVPIKGFKEMQFMLLTGSDNPYPTTPVRQVMQGPPQGSIAVCTKLGWAIQGPANSMLPQKGEIH